MTHSYVTRLVHTCAMTDSCVMQSALWLWAKENAWQDSFLCGMTQFCVTWLIFMWHDSILCDMTHFYVAWLNFVWHDSFLCGMTQFCVTWLISVWHDSILCDMTHLHMCHDWFICDAKCTVSISKGECVTWLFFTWHDSFLRDMTLFYVTWLFFTWYGVATISRIDKL